MANEIPVKFHWSILCEDVRREDNGKLIIIGVYVPDIVISQLPTALSSLVFLQMLEWLQPGQYTLKSTLNCLTGSGVSEIARGLSMSQVKGRGMAPLPVRFGNLQLQQHGDYQFQTFLDGVEDPIVDHRFRVIFKPK